MKQDHRNWTFFDSGFTLIEVAVSLGIIGFITAGGIFIYLHVLRSTNQAASVVQVDSVANLIMETMVREIRAAPCLSGGNQEIDILDTQCVTTEVTFTLDGDDNLLRTEGDETSALNPPSVSVTNLLFSAGSASISTTTKAVRIEMTVAVRNPYRSEYEASVDLTEIVSLRRY